MCVDIGRQRCPMNQQTIVVGFHHSITVCEEGGVDRSRLLEEYVVAIWGPCNEHPRSSLNLKNNI